jgi:hypothetical protein
MTRLVLLLAAGSLSIAQPQPVAPSQPPADPGCTLPASWRRVVVTAASPAAEDLTGREVLSVPGTVPRPGVASPTRAPWVQANGWRILRNPAARFTYDLPAGKGALGLAEALAYGADALVRIDAADTAAACSVLDLAGRIPAADLPALADFAVVDDGSPIVGEVMNLLVRRNLLFERVTAPVSRFAFTVQVGTPEFPVERAANPSAFALEIRRRITDDRRSLRIFGSEVVVARASGDANRARIHLLNYGGRAIEGLRVRLRGTYAPGTVHIVGSAPSATLDHTVVDGATEFSLSRLQTWAVVDLASK